MPSRRAIAILGLIALTSGARAQTVQAPAPQRQPLPPAAATPGMGARPVDLDSARRRFDADAARRAEGDRKRDGQLGRSMRSICEGCGGDTAAGRPRPVRSKARSTRATESDPSDE